MRRKMWSAIILAALAVSILPGAVERVAAQTPATTTATVATTATAALAKPVSSILFVGDSNSFYLHKCFPKLTASADPPLRIKAGDFTRGASSLRGLWPLPLKEIRTGTWDVVVLEEDPDNRLDKKPEEYSLEYARWFQEYARKFHGEIAQAGAETVLYMTWPDRGETSLTTEDLAEVYTTTGKDLGVSVAPVGLAFQRAEKERPDLELRAPDGDHSSPNGFYLTLCVLYATIFNHSPMGMSYRIANVDPASDEGLSWSLPADWALSDEDAAFLQKVAWDTVTEYRAEQGH